ncbi:MAG: glycosyltransferase family 4 protein [Bacteroidetes bacterium]|nr:glycosyltransferase family 4 protein [Bacteroidota bacterium]
MKILFLAPYPVNESPSQRYRFEHYLALLTKEGITYSYQPFLSISAWKFFFLPGRHFQKALAVLGGFIRRWLLMFTVGKYDFVFVHREAAPLGPPIFEWIIAKIFCKKMIFDFDDAIWVPVASENNRIAKFFKWPSKIATICKISYKVSAGNEYLAAFASKYCKNVEIVPTVVNTELVHNKLQNQQTDNPNIGWTGTFSTLKYLDLVIPALQNLQLKYNFTFIVIANKNPELRLRNYQFIEWRKETEAADLLKMHIGLMPLLDDEISKGKCGFKAIQYMSLGIPALVSPVGVNANIVDDGVNGFVCESIDDWENKLEELLKSASLRAQMGNAARMKIEKNYSVSSSWLLFRNLFR